MIEIEREEDRVVFHRGFLDDPRLSLRAKGLLAVLLSRPGVVVNLQTLAAGTGDRVSGVEEAFRQLESAGYFTRAESVTGENPALAGTVRETSVLPLLLDRPSRHSSAEPRQGGRPGGAVDEESLKAAAERVLARLNELRKASWSWVKYTPLSARHAKQLEHIKGRMHEGYAEEDLILVLEYLAAVDGGKDESRKYFDGVTPFNTKNFERNLAMAREWEGRGCPRGNGALALQRADGHDPAIYESQVKGGEK
ncbi:MAG: hypothetical protein NTX23_01160 [Candidatus Bipolaricaulota bacterium]|nr:hypothetical protein [Candidatus Bipolaricaulota bacterium]